ncbi:MAG: MGMT family protein [Pseudomonadota bacterium]
MGADYSPIYELLSDIPRGAVASYGMIASLVSGAGPRQAARAMRTAPKGLPWHRVVTASGALAHHAGAEKQKRLLKKEGVRFRKNGAVDWSSCRWEGPSPDWVLKTGADPLEVMEIVAGWRR